MKKNIKIKGFIDLGSLKKGQGMIFHDKQGNVYKTSPIVNFSVYSGRVYCETKNTIYTNY